MHNFLQRVPLGITLPGGQVGIHFCPPLYWSQDQTPCMPSYSGDFCKAMPYAILPKQQNTSINSLTPPLLTCQQLKTISTSLLYYFLSRTENYRSWGKKNLQRKCSVFVEKQKGGSSGSLLVHSTCNQMPPPGTVCSSCSI